jgi:hypothetical protein
MNGLMELRGGGGLLWREIHKGTPHREHLLVVTVTVASLSSAEAKFAPSASRRPWVIHAEDFGRRLAK